MVRLSGIKAMVTPWVLEGAACLTLWDSADPRGFVKIKFEEEDGMADYTESKNGDRFAIVGNAIWRNGLVQRAVEEVTTYSAKYITRSGKILALEADSKQGLLERYVELWDLEEDIQQVQDALDLLAEGDGYDAARSALQRHLEELEAALD